MDDPCAVEKSEFLRVMLLPKNNKWVMVRYILISIISLALGIFAVIRAIVGQDLWGQLSDQRSNVKMWAFAIGSFTSIPVLSCLLFFPVSAFGFLLITVTLLVIGALLSHFMHPKADDELTFWEKVWLGWVFFALGMWGVGLLSWLHVVFQHPQFYNSENYEDSPEHDIFKKKEQECLRSYRNSADRRAQDRARSESKTSPENQDEIWKEQGQEAWNRGYDAANARWRQ